LEVISILKQTASKDLDFSDYPKTPPANFNLDTSWDVSPIAPFDSGGFVDNGDAEGTWSPWFGYGRIDAEAAVAEALNRNLQTGNRVFQDSSSPDKNIPDNNSSGIKDKIICDDEFAIDAIKISVDITHTYIGDLRVSLTSPSGTTVVLHNRLGGSANDLHAEFDTRSLPALLAMTGESVNGEWILHVQDLAAIDQGRLKSWSLEIRGQEHKSITVEESPGIIIPDNRQDGIERSLSVSETAQLNSIEVDLDITHTYIGDLIVELVSPNNTSVLLHNRTGGSANNIIKTYTMMNMSSLHNLRGGSIGGDWKLKVSDHASIDKGKLNRWALRITAQ